MTYAVTESRASRAALDASMPPVLTPTAVELGEADLCADMERFAEFILEGDDREHSKYFGPVATCEVITQFLLNPKANDEQIVAAVRLIRARYVSQYSAFVMEAAGRAMEA